MGPEMSIFVSTIKYGAHKFHLAKTTFMPQMFALALPSGAPYIKKFNVM